MLERRGRDMDYIRSRVTSYLAFNSMDEFCILLVDL